MSDSERHAMLLATGVVWGIPVGTVVVLATDLINGVLQTGDLGGLGVQVAVAAAATLWFHSRFKRKASGVERVCGDCGATWTEWSCKCASA